MDNVGELFPFDENVSNAVGEANITVGFAVGKANITVGVVDLTSTIITTRIYR
jgi:hypothetical protein